MFTNMNTMFGGAFLIGILTAAWGKIKAVLSRLWSIPIASVTCYGQLATAVKGHCWSHYKRNPYGQRLYSSDRIFVRPLRKYQSVPYEMLSTDPVIFWNGWRPMLLGAREDPSRPKELASTSAGLGSNIITLTYLRGTINIDKFLTHAMDEFNRKLGSEEDKTNNRRKRFFIRRFIGSGGMKSRIGMKHGGDQDGGPGITPSNGSNGISIDAIETGELRILKWLKDEIGPELSVSQKALDCLAFPDNVKRIIVDLDHWLKSAEWYYMKQIPWTRGGTIYGPPGTGKCLARGTPVLMFDGSIKTVEDVKSGDLLMGPDSRHRRVRGTTTGRETMYRITPKKGDPYVVNESHVLSLRMNTNAAGFKKSELVNISVHDYLKMSNHFKHHAKGWRTGVTFSAKDVPLDPYILGVWLGDGTATKPEVTTEDLEIGQALWRYATANQLRLNAVDQSGASTIFQVSGGPEGKRKPQFTNHLRRSLRDLNLYNNKHIPECYRVNSREVRLQILAGLMDTDGEVSCGGYSITSKFKQLADDIAYVCRSLGFAAYTKQVWKSCTNCVDTEKRPYWRVSISGDTSIIPVKMARKANGPRKQKKDVLRVGITVERIGEGDYYGFEIDRDGLFLLGDFTVTHNTSFVRAVGQDFDLPVFAFDLGSMSNEEFCRYWNEMQGHAPCIALVEDIDGVFRGRVNILGEQGGGLTFDCFLNMLGGIENANGVFKILTTNDLSSIDEALGKPRALNNSDDDDESMSTRPGRMDWAIELTYLTEQSRREIAQRILSDCPQYIEKLVAKGNGDTGAQFQERCAKIALREHWRAKEESE